MNGCLWVKYRSLQCGGNLPWKIPEEATGNTDFLTEDNLITKLIREITVESLQCIMDKKDRMIDYSTYRAEDFLLDDGFVNHCKNRDDQKDFWEGLPDKYPGIEKEIKKAIHLFEYMRLETSPEQKEVALNKLKTILLSDKQIPEPVQFHKTTRTFRRINFFIAAALILGAIAAGSFWYHTAFLKQNTPLDYSPGQFTLAITSPADDRKEVSLPDGSTVLLNYGSSIRLEENYNVKTRRISLEGEAFFNVVPDTKRPFTVLTEHSQTTALGTSFKVKDFPGENFSNVMLATGKVKVMPVSNEERQEPFFLIPGKQITLDQAGNAVPGRFSQQELTDWKNIHINFESADLAEISRKVTLYYGVQIVLQNEPKKQVALTGQFYNKPLKEVLEAISYTNKLTYQQKQNTIYIQFNAGNN